MQIQSVYTRQWSTNIEHRKPMFYSPPSLVQIGSLGSQLIHSCITEYESHFSCLHHQFNQDLKVKYYDFNGSFSTVSIAPLSSTDRCVNWCRYLSICIIWRQTFTGTLFSLNSTESPARHKTLKWAVGAVSSGTRHFPESLSLRVALEKGRRSL